MATLKELKDSGKYIEYLQNSACMPDIILLRSVFDVPSTSLGTLLTYAAIGGKNATYYNGGTYKSAFKIKETGDGAYDGELLMADGLVSAYPCWNIYSNQSGGEWRKGAGLNLYFRLKRDFTASNYNYTLEAFRGYNHNANYASIEDGEVVGASGQTRDFTLNWHSSDYDWRKCDSQVKKIQVQVMNGSLKGTMWDYTPGISKREIIRTTLSTSRVDTLVIALCDSLGETLFYLPVRGKLDYTIQNQNSARIYMRFDKTNAMSDPVYPTMGANIISAPISRPVAYPSRTLRLLQVQTTVTVNDVIVYDKTRGPINGDAMTFDWVESSKPTVTAYLPTEAWASIGASGAAIRLKMQYQ